MLGTSVMSAKAAYAIGQSGSMEGPLGKGAEIFSVFSSAYARERREAMSLADFLDGCRNDPGMTASAAERMIAAIGEPIVVDTAKDQRLGRIFLNRTIKLYPTLSGFFGMEDTIQRVVGYFQHAAQGLEERKQILYLLGPVGGGKSSLAERLKALMETQPIYVLSAGDEMSPVFEVAARPLPPGDDGRRPREPLRHSRPAPDRRLLAVGGQAPRFLRRRHFALLRR